MSGTSLDGLDIAFCELKYHSGSWHFDLKASKSLEYNDEMCLTLKESIYLSALDLLKLNRDYGVWLGEMVRDFIQENQIKADYIASHGHTVHHRPELGITYQIGDGQQLANITRMTTICDFRSKDISLGGHGAPLVPIGDKYLFSEYDLCLNLGGISNVSFDLKEERVAYDIGLANMILNYITAKINLKYDKEGRRARSGALNKALFKELNALAYYQLPFPKSTGYEWFVSSVAPLVDASNISIEDKLCTAVHHIAYSIARDVKKYVKGRNRILVTGGGAKNTFLIQCLENYLGELVEVFIPDADIIEFKEAIVFGLLGVLRIRNETNCLKSVTGASQDYCGGVFYSPV